MNFNFTNKLKENKILLNKYNKKLSVKCRHNCGFKKPLIIDKYSKQKKLFYE